jgi:hypothetical protein
MFDSRGDHVAFFRLAAQGGPDGGIVRLGPAGGIYDFFRVRAQEVGQVVAGFF